MKYLAIILLFSFVSIVGRRGLETPTEDLPSIAEEMVDISDEELKAEIENKEDKTVVGRSFQKYRLKYSASTLKKVLSYRQSQKEPIYELTFNPKDWSKV